MAHNSAATPSNPSPAAFTLGPWKVGERLASDNTIPVLQEWNGKGSRVVAYVTPKPCFEDMAAANARLIAAAPALLQALRDVIRSLDSLSSEVFDHHTPFSGLIDPRKASVVFDARAAISQATTL